MNLIPGKSSFVSGISDWYSLDIGFSSKSPTCGAYRTDRSEPSSLCFGELADDIVAFASDKGRLGLIIEAPLSCSFNSRGNPCWRFPFEKQGSATRYWFAGLGCAVMTAALFLLRQLHQIATNQEIVLYEGFVSFKKSVTSHEDDARMLFEKRHTALDADQIRTNETSLLVGITSLFGGASEAPGVIVCQPVPHPTGGFL